MLLLLLACDGNSDQKKKPDEPTAVDSHDATDSVLDSNDSSSTPPCTETAGGTIDESQDEWQQWDDGRARYSIDSFDSFTSSGGRTYDFSDTQGWEAVRFELAHPSRIVALQVYYSMLPAEKAPVTMGFYADWGTNGFDYHIDQPLWTGTRCLDASSADGWVTYKLDPPLDFAGPGVLYAASFRDGDKGPKVAMDGGTSGDGTCGAWDECHSALRYPDVDTRSYYTGTSFPLQYDLMMRMQYETTSEVAPENTWFHQDTASGLPASGNISWGDYDDDGDDDIMLAGPSLYRNDGGVFVDVSAEAGVQVGIGTSGGVWGDYDNDGCLDFYGMNPSRDAGPAGNELLLHSNCDGTFSDMTALAGIDDLQDSVDCLTEGTPQHSPTYGATWADFDNDGLLDLVQANFLCFDDYTYYPDRFWHNKGDGVFEEWKDDHGFEWDNLAGRGAVALDADQDGDIDIAINNYVLHRNLYYENQGGGQFLEKASDVGQAGKNTSGYYGHTIGEAWGDLDNDGDWDAVHANLAHPRYYPFSDRTNILLLDAGLWTNVADTNGIVYQETHSNPSLLDFENDGDLDLTITEVYDGRPTDVYVNDGTAHFTGAREEAGIATENGWGSAVADYDNDGDQDLMISNLYRNDYATGHWLELRLVGDVHSNRAAIGATAYVTVDGVTHIAFVSGGNGVSNQDSLTLHFGLGTSTNIEKVEVWYPGGDTVQYSGLVADKAWRLTESGTVKEGLAP